MTEYRRFYLPNCVWFFTVSLAERKNNRLLVDHIDLLRDAFRYTNRQKPFFVDAIVILLDYLHCLFMDIADNYSIPWDMLKGYFSRNIANGERILSNREKMW